MSRYLQRVRGGLDDKPSLRRSASSLTRTDDTIFSRFVTFLYVCVCSLDCVQGRFPSPNSECREKKKRERERECSLNFFSRKIHSNGVKSLFEIKESFSRLEWSFSLSLVEGERERKKRDNTYRDTFYILQQQMVKYLLVIFFLAK